MLVSHRKRFIFTKTIKTAGTSVEAYFEPYCMAPGAWHFSHARDQYVSKEGIIGYRGINPSGKKWFNHMSASRIREQLGRELWDQYFKFCVVRDPFDKLVSAFHHIEKQYHQQSLGRHNLRRKLKYWLNKPKGNTNFERFRSWVKQGGAVIDRDKYLCDDKICMDYFIHYENLLEGVQHVCNVLDIAFEADRLPRLKVGLRPEAARLSDYYDSETVDIVARLYEFEIEHFGYQPPEVAR